MSGLSGAFLDPPVVILSVNKSGGSQTRNRSFKCFLLGLLAAAKRMPEIAGVVFLG